MTNREENRGICQLFDYLVFFGYTLSFVFYGLYLKIPLRRKMHPEYLEVDLIAKK
jgi:hypothetical protein